MPIKQSLCLPCFYNDNDSLEEFLDFIAETGFAAAEIWHRDNFAQFDAFVRAMQKRNLVIPSMGGHNSIVSGMNDESQHQRIQDELKESIQVAADNDIKSIICFAGERLAGQSDYQALLNCVRCLEAVLPFAEKHKISLNLELLNSKIDHFNYVGDHFEWGYALCDMIKSPSAKLLFDIYHMQIMDGDLIRNITKGIDYIGHFHTAGHPGRNDLDDAQEIHYAAVCRAIANTNYDAYLGHEFWTKLDDKKAALKAAFKTCDV